jgi:hypothetical protein
MSGRSSWRGILIAFSMVKTCSTGTRVHTATVEELRSTRRASLRTPAALGDGDLKPGVAALVGHGEQKS